MTPGHTDGLVRALVALLACAGCGSGDLLAGETSAVDGNGVVADLDTAEANSTVYIRANHTDPDGSSYTTSCSGMLLTSQIVVTAQHCITGRNGHNCHAPYGPSQFLVTLGPHRCTDDPGGCTGGFTVDAVKTRTSGCNDNEWSDVALLYLHTPIAESSIQQALPGLSKRPPGTPLEAPGTKSPFWPASPIVPLATLTSPGPGDYGVAGYAGGTSGRFRKDFNSDGLENSEEQDDSYWYIINSDWSTAPGDSGGPLFNYDDGERKLIGVLSGGHEVLGGGTEHRWADLTRFGNHTFLLDSIMERNVPAPLTRHTTLWRQRHGQTEADRWWGQLDYTGPCNAARDWDCDGWYDHGSPPYHDNCPSKDKPNPDQTDTDDDGIGDACDTFPNDANNDPDGDGWADKPIVGVPWSGKGDNCPRVWNKDQANCNARVEDKHGAEVLGDACDPNPCPSPIVDDHGLHPWTCDGLDPQFGGICQGRGAQNTLAVTRVAPHVRDAVGIEKPVLLPNVTTDARFCQDNPVQGFDCHAPESLRDSWLWTLDRYSMWHLVTIDGSFGTWTWNYDQTAITQQWNYLDDWQRWITPMNGYSLPRPVPSYYQVCSDTNRVGTGTCLDGVMWYHAGSGVGRTTDYVNGTWVGFHHVALQSAIASDMTNGYVDLKPDYAYAQTFGGKGLMRALILPIPSGDPAPYERQRVHLRPLVAEQVGATPQVLVDVGVTQDATEKISATFAATLPYDGYRWMAAAGAPGAPSQLDARIHGVQMDMYGSFVGDAVFSEGGVEHLASELAPFSSVGAAGAPVQRVGWAGTFSPALGGVVVAGGTNVWTGEPLHDVQLWRNGIGWQPVPVAAELQHPAAVVYSIEDRALWILDYQDGGSAELYEVDPFSGETVSRGRFDRDVDVWDRHALALDRDGTVLLIASSRTRHASSVARLGIDPFAGYAFASVLDESLPYTTDDAIVDRDEYGFVVRDDAGAIDSVVRREELAGGPSRIDGMFR